MRRCRRQNGLAVTALQAVALLFAVLIPMTAGAEPPAGLGAGTQGAIPWTLVAFIVLVLFFIIGAFLFLNHSLSAQIQRITDALQRQREKERELERRYREILENTRDMVYRLSLATGRFDYVSPSVEPILGYRVDEILDLDFARFRQLIHPQDREAHIRIQEEILKLRAPAQPKGDFTFRIRHRQGHDVWVNDRCAIAYEEDGRPAALVGSARDVSSLRAAREQLARSEADFRQFFNSCPDGIILIDTNGALCAANPAFAEILGYANVEDLVGRSVQELTPPEWQPLTDRALERIRAGIPFYEVTEKEYLRRDGTKVPVSLQTWIIRDEDDSISGVGVFVRDVTREKQMAAVQHQLERQLRQTQKMEAIGTLAGGIAHDFNNILWGMTGFIELAADQIETEPAQARASLDRVLQAGERAKDLVRQILQFSRQTEAGMAPLEIGAIVKEASKLLRATLPATIEMRLAITVQAGTVQADASQIHQVVMNLCTNAFQSMADGRGVLTIGLDSVFAEVPIACRSINLPPGPYVRLVVGDTGGGIAAENLERIFDPYFTTKPPGQGTGLGLAVSMGIVKSHRGGIQVDSVPGRGTTFRVFFPAVKADAAASKAPAQPIVGGSESLLLVDDESLFADMTRRMLEALGYRVACADSGTQALELFRQDPDGFDLVISDQTMPRMTGLELARKIHAQRPGLPMILCTGFSEAVTVESRSDAGIQRVLLKPVTRQEMAGAIREVLDSRKAVHG